MQSTPTSLDSGVEHELCSIASSNETADNLPGPGRLLGNFYVSAGRRLENGLGRAALRMGFSPETVKIQDNHDDEPFHSPPRHHEPASTSRGEDIEYELCSNSSSNETADNLPGPGRTLGKFYASTGQRLENGFGMVAMRMGRGPSTIAMKIRKILEDESLHSFTRRKKLKKKCRSLAQYIKSHAPSTQEQALNRIIDLSIANDNLRELFNAFASKDIRLLYEDPYIWFNLTASLQNTSRRALKVLADARNAKIAFLFDSIFLSSPPSDETQNHTLAELDQYLRDPDVSFLVIRHIRRLVQQNDGVLLCSTMIQDLVTRNGDFESTDEHQVYNRLEGNIEWSEFDEVVQHVSDDLSEYSFLYFHLLDMFFRNPDKLPKAFGALLAWIAALETDDLGQLIPSLGRLHDFASGVKNLRSFDISSYAHRLVAPLRQRLENPLDMTLAKICVGHDILRYTAEGKTSKFICGLSKTHNPLSNPYYVLATSADSGNVSIQKTALANIRIALSVNRYTRRKMLDALIPTAFSRKADYEVLVSETLSMCIPKACAGREHGPCALHGSHKLIYYRHCGPRGELIHMKSYDDKCNGECGATEEHFMEYDSEDAATLSIKTGCAFSTMGHYPLIAGYTAAGEPLYSGKLPDSYNFGYFDFAIPSNARPEEINIKLHNADGSVTTFRPPQDGQTVFITALLYDPHAYDLCNHYSIKGKEASGMDATGPFSWKFLRKLPATRFHEQLLPDKASIRAPLMVWVEASIEPGENVRVEEDSNFEQINGHVNSDIEMQKGRDF